MFDRELIDEISKQARIVDIISSYGINVIPAGKDEYTCICPFHDDHSPSLRIHADSRNFCKCFVCGASAFPITFVQKYEHIPFQEAVIRTAEKIGFQDPRLQAQVPVVKLDPEKERLRACINDVASFYLYCLSIEEAAPAREYLASRNIDEDLIKRYGIGYAPKDGAATVKFLKAKGHSFETIKDIGIGYVASSGGEPADRNAGRLVFLLKDHRGDVVGFSARIVQNTAHADRKYVNTGETPLFHKSDVLYHYSDIAESARHDRYCYLTEGFMDVMALDKAGLPNAVATMGTALTEHHVMLLKRLRCEIRYCLDGDAAGQKAMEATIGLLEKAGIPFRIVDYEGDDRDPDDILQHDGPEALFKRANTLIDPIDFRLNFYLNVKPLQTVADRQRALQDFLPYLRRQKPGIEYENALVKLSRATRFEVEAIRSLAAAQGDPDEEEISSFTKGSERVMIVQPSGKYRCLQLAERNALCYMLNKRDAILYFQKYIKTFTTDIYLNIANYLIEYARNHPDADVDLSVLLSFIQNFEESPEQAQLLEKTITDLIEANKTNAYSEAAMQRCAGKIVEEREKAHAESVAKQATTGVTAKEGAESLNSIVQKRREALQKKKK